MANMHKASLVMRKKQKSQSGNITQPTPRLKSFLMTTPSVGEDVETTGSLIHSWWDDKLVKPLGKLAVYQLKLNMCLPRDPAILLQK